jgi:hypothetical protein
LNHDSGGDQNGWAAIMPTHFFTLLENLEIFALALMKEIA